MHLRFVFRASRRAAVFFAIANVFCVSCATAAPQTCADPQKPVAGPETVTLKAVGDIVLGSDWPVSRYPAGFDKDAQARLRRVLGNADVTFGNFEGALTAHDVSTKTTGSAASFAFRMPSRFASLLKSVGFNVMHIANNHSFDFGEVGFNDTVTNFSNEDIYTIGHKDTVVLQKIKDVVIGWVALSYSWRFDDMADFALLADLINRARAQADWVVVSVQAGAEGSEALRVVDQEEMFFGENRGNVFAFAHRAVDLGADLVLGHGPHVLRGMECYKGKLIAYSLGNFVGYGALTTKRAAALSIVLELRFSKSESRYSFEVVPLAFDPQHFPVIDPDQRAYYLINDLSRLPPLSGTIQLPANPGAYAKYRAWRTAADIDYIQSP